MGNDGPPADIQEILADIGYTRPDYGVRGSVDSAGGALRGPQEIHLKWFRIESTNKEALLLRKDPGDVGVLSFWLNEAKLNAGRDKGPAITLDGGTLYMDNHCYIETPGTGTGPGMIIDNTNGKSTLVSEGTGVAGDNIHIGLSSGPLGTYDVSVSFINGYANNIINYLADQVKLMRIIGNTFRLIPTTLTQAGGIKQIFGNYYLNPEANTYSLVPQEILQLGSSGGVVLSIFSASDNNTATKEYLRSRGTHISPTNIVGGDGIIYENFKAYYNGWKLYGATAWTVADAANQQSYFYIRPDLSGSKEHRFGVDGYKMTPIPAAQAGNGCLFRNSDDGNKLYHKDDSGGVHALY